MKYKSFKEYYESKNLEYEFAGDWGWIDSYKINGGIRLSSCFYGLDLIEEGNYQQLEEFVRGLDEHLEANLPPELDWIVDPHCDTGIGAGSWDLIIAIYEGVSVVLNAFAFYQLVKHIREYIEKHQTEYPGEENRRSLVINMEAAKKIAIGVCCDQYGLKEKETRITNIEYHYRLENDYPHARIYEPDLEILSNATFTIEDTTTGNEYTCEVAPSGLVVNLDKIGQ